MRGRGGMLRRGGGDPVCAAAYKRGPKPLIRPAQFSPHSYHRCCCCCYMNKPAVLRGRCYLCQCVREPGPAVPSPLLLLLREQASCSQAALLLLPPSPRLCPPHCQAA